MADRPRCPGCGGYPTERQRLTLPRKITGDLVFCGYHCMAQWEARGRVAMKGT